MRFEKIVLSHRKISQCVVVILFVLFIGIIYTAVDSQMTIDASHRELEAEWLNVQSECLKSELTNSEEYKRLVARRDVLSNQLYTDLWKKFVDVTTRIFIAFVIATCATVIGFTLVNNTKK